MPERVAIGTKKAFEKNYSFPYEKKQIGSVPEMKFWCCDARAGLGLGAAMPERDLVDTSVPSTSLPLPCALSAETRVP